MPRLPREYWTLWVAFDLANGIKRATNFGLKVGGEIRQNIQRLPLLAKVVDDLLLAVSGPIRDVEDSMAKLVNIFNYIDTVPGHILIHKPLTDEVYIDNRWQPRRKKKDAIAALLEQSLKDPRVPL